MKLENTTGNIGPIDIWVQPKKGNSIVVRKASWPIYNEKFEDLNKYSNGSHSKRLQGEKRLRRILNKKK